MCQIKLLYLYCLVVVGFSESEADDLEMLLPRKIRSKKKGVSNEITVPLLISCSRVL